MLIRLFRRPRLDRDGHDQFATRSGDNGTRTIEGQSDELSFAASLAPIGIARAGTGGPAACNGPQRAESASALISQPPSQKMLQ